MLRLTAISVGLAFALSCGGVSASIADPSLNYDPAKDVLQPDADHASLSKTIVTALTDNHYQTLPVDNKLSGEMLDRYLDDLDPTHSLFLTTDIEILHKNLKDQLDDQLKSGKLKDAFDIFNAAQRRRFERMNYQLDLLAKGPEAYELNKHEEMLTDRKKAPWPADEAALHDLWRKQMKSSVLSLMLTDKTEEEATQTLERRFTNQIKRLRQTNNEDAFQIYMNAFAELHDPHTQYFSPQTSENFNINMSLSLEGIGAVLQSEDEQTKVVRLVAGGPAEKSKQLNPADIIVGVAQGDDGEMVDVVGWRLDEVVDKIRGPKDSVVRLQIIPAGSADKKTKIVRLVRNKVKLEDQAAKKKVIDIPQADGKAPMHVGVITLPTFYMDFQAAQNGDPNYKSTSRDVAKLIEELKKDDIKGLILDLRNDGGGSLQEANKLIGLFIRQGPTVQVRDAKGRVNILGDSDPSVAYDGPLIVLVNRLSASASEIFAGAMQDYGRALIVGSQTFGKGTVQTVLPLPSGQLKLTQAKFYRISGQSTQHKGVVPDISFPTLIDNDQIGESALDHALPWDKVRPLRYPLYGDYGFILDELRQRHLERTGNDPDFDYMVNLMKRQTALRKETTTPLWLDALKSEREKNEAWDLQQENIRRKAKGEEPLTNFEQIEQLNKEDGMDDPILTETGKVMSDMVQLSAKEKEKE
ncbi:carboxy terminal-processing peptidase [Pokkaliibacter sp. CJK22405]|uniref:carboxy terminal-processing peptidase n=1 Tax=Pokkaliibacter sp. CJK22405 TaxID=3384615 RepID=UPI003984B85E